MRAGVAGSLLCLSDQLLGQLVEQVINTCRILGRSCEVHKVELVGKLDRLFLSNSSVLLQIRFASHYCFELIISCIAIYFSHPLLKVVKCFEVRNVVAAKDSV
eukprot:TRINITY_DN4226_c0_g1_i2.p1 TRINITY_DN4226_c0_g1~~TRINITY_DN4226_c0_g1_i2.p1  ORF type:complete len:103 (+),score=1.11 TRINITY_DN4226_c0_g1_i2:304-612(+)